MIIDADGHSVASLEANAGWMPFWLHRLEEHCETMGWTLPHDVRRLPTEILAEQCWVGCEGEEWGLAAVVRRHAGATPYAAGSGDGGR